jgi:hypothetical protein
MTPRRAPQPVKRQIAAEARKSPPALLDSGNNTVSLPETINEAR